MTENTYIDASTTSAEVVATVALKAAEPTKISDELLVYNLGEKTQVVDLAKTIEEHQPNPRRKRGTFLAHDDRAFTGYLAKHAVEETEVWADTQRFKVVGVINAHEGVEGPHVDGPAAGWGDHRVVLEARKTIAWKAWEEHDGELLSQSAFAELIEDRAIDIVEPSSADMLELAQSFHATNQMRFESSQQLSSGERQLQYRENVTATAGKTGRMEIPNEFKLAIAPFEGSPTYGIKARLRYRIQDGVLRLGYKLERPEDVQREAFNDVVNAIDIAVTAPVYRGVSA